MPITRFSTNFEEVAENTQPLNTTERWGATASWPVITDASGTAVGGKRMTISGGGSGQAISFDAAGTGADVDVLVRIRVDQFSSGSDRMVAAALRGSGDDLTRGGYFFGIFKPIGDYATTPPWFAIWKRTSGSFSDLTGSTRLYLLREAYYWIRVQMQGTAFKTKIWSGPVEDEPDSWSIEGTDSSHASGWFGIASEDGLAGQFIDVFAVGTPSHPAALSVPPVANAGVDVTAVEKTVISLDGSKSYDQDDTAGLADDGASAVLQYSWVQTLGTPVTLIDGNTRFPYFTVPDHTGTSDDILGFTLTITDSDGDESTDSKIVEVLKSTTGVFRYNPETGLVIPLTIHTYP